VNSTFLKRKGGLFKKAHELSVLCSVDVAVIIFGNNKKLYEYSSSDIGEILTRYQYVRRRPVECAYSELIMHSMEAPMNTKVRQTSVGRGKWTTMTMMMMGRILLSMDQLSLLR
jgi:hypothetical protein